MTTWNLNYLKTAADDSAPAEVFRKASLSYVFCTSEQQRGTRKRLHCVSLGCCVQRREKISRTRRGRPLPLHSSGKRTPRTANSLVEKLARDRAYIQRSANYP